MTSDDELGVFFYLNNLSAIVSAPLLACMLGPSSLPNLECLGVQMRVSLIWQVSLYVSP